MALREDVVKIGFDIDDGGFGELKKMLDDLKKGFKDTDKNANEAEDEINKIAKTNLNRVTDGAKKLASAFGTVATKAGLALGKATALAGAGVGALATQSVKSFANYEQLVGGVETLFKDSAGTVQKHADEAYRSAGLSQNEYMETVTGFSASLIQSLGGDTGAAAQYADMAIRDMSDNANKMGTDMASIQYAYQGFAKQNYTMLDNLKLGYGGTKEEMQRLLKDAEKLTGKKLDIKSYADVIEAIHAIQDNMGVTGTTAAEADKTITGSFNSMKAAYGNMMNALILGGDDFDRALDNLVGTAKTFMKNLIPALSKSLGGIGDLIVEVAPIIEKELPGLIETLLPPLIKAASSLVRGLITALPSIIDTLIKELPTILSEVWKAVEDTFGDKFPSIKKVGELFGDIGKFCTENQGTVKKLVPLLLGLIAGFKLLKRFGGIKSLFGKSGSGNGGIFSGFTSLGKMKTSTLLKGMGNLAIIFGGLMGLAAAFMWLAPYMAELSDLKSVGEVLLVIGGVGLIGTALTKLSSKVGNIPVATVAKGLANIAIVMVGLGALSALLMWVAPYVSELSDLRTTFEMLLVIGAVGLVGSALAGLAGLIGAIPIVTVLSGLANIALALLGFTAIVAAFGALSKIPGYNEFIKDGGDAVAEICRILGNVAGSLIAGIAEGLVSTLPNIGKKLSEFATNVKPMFDTFATVDTNGLGDFALGFAALVAALTGEKLVSVITGSVDYEGLGTKLSNMATNLEPFFNTVTTLPDGGLQKATDLFDTLAGVKGLPKEGGIVDWFVGTVNFTKIADGVTALGSEEMTAALGRIGNISDDSFTKAASLFNTLSGLDKLPADGGVVGWFMGEVDFTKISDGIKKFGDETFIAALTTISKIPEAAFTQLSGLFNALAGIKSLPEDGGVVGWFAGEHSTALEKLSEKLPDLATNVIKFYDTLGGRINFSAIKYLFNAFAEVKDFPKEGGIASWFTGDSSTAMTNIGDGLVKVADRLNTFFTTLGGNKDNLADIGTLFDNFVKIPSVEEAGNLQSSLNTLASALSAFARDSEEFWTATYYSEPEAITNLFNVLTKDYSNTKPLNGLETALNTTLTNMLTDTETKIDEMLTAITSGVDAMSLAFTSMQPVFYVSGVNMMLGVKTGMLSMLPSLIIAAQSMAAAIQSAFDVSFKIASPSKVMERKGEFVGAGSVIGLRNMIPEAKAAAQDFAFASMPFDTYTPESSVNTYNSRTTTETTNIAPVFELHITGSTDDRATARKVKRYVADAVKETLESYGRRSPSVREA